MSHIQKFFRLEKDKNNSIVKKEKKYDPWTKNCGTCDYCKEVHVNSNDIWSMYFCRHPNIMKLCGINKITLKRGDLVDATEFVNLIPEAEIQGKYNCECENYMFYGCHFIVSEKNKESLDKAWRLE